MKYTKVHIEALAYELPPVVVTSEELEERLAPLFKKLHIPSGQLLQWTGITERRWWDAGHELSQGAIAAARKALSGSGVPARDLEALIYAGVCRENFEPATACRVAASLGINPRASVFDVSNACLGVLNGIVDIANRIELGQLRAGMVVSCESAREIVERTIDRMLERPEMDLFKSSVATLTGGSGAVAVLLTDGSYSTSKRRRLLGGENMAAPEHYGLCRWGLQKMTSLGTHVATQVMTTDSPLVLKYGVDLGLRTWLGFLGHVGWATEQVDKVICHQVGSGHQNSILKTLGIAPEKDFVTYPYLGNIGTVSLPLTAALAEERAFLKAGDRVGFLGIGSGLNCMMLGIEW